MDYTSEQSAGIAAVGAIGGIIYLALIVLIIASLWKVFTKAGKPGWASLIPIYNIIVLLEIIGKPTIWILWMLIPCVNIYFGIWAMNLLSKSFGKSEGFTAGLLLLPMVFYPILGFGDARYLGPAAAEAQQGFPGTNNQFGTNNPFGTNDPFNKPPTTPQA